jgi:hypothetical protein
LLYFLRRRRHKTPAAVSTLSDLDSKSSRNPASPVSELTSSPSHRWTIRSELVGSPKSPVELP